MKPRVSLGRRSQLGRLSRRLAEVEVAEKERPGGFPPCQYK